MNRLAEGVLSYGAAPSALVHLHVLLFGVQTGGLALLADATELLSIVWYLGSVRRLRRRGRSWSPWAAGAFCGGIATIWLAVGSGVAAYDDVNVPFHALQHVLLMMVAAPLVALGKPVTLAAQAAKRRNQVRLLAIVHSAPVSALTFPVLTWLLYYGSMYVFFLDRRVYDYTVVHPLAHEASHLLLLAIGYLYWQPLIGSDPSRWRLSPPARVASMFLGMPFEAFLGISISFMQRPIDPINTLADTRAGGDLFWILAMSASGLCIAISSLDWFRQIERQTPREDRKAEAEARRSREQAADLGIRGIRDGWTVPWWRLAEVAAQQRAGSAERPPQRTARSGERPAERPAQPR